MTEVALAIKHNILTPFDNKISKGDSFSGIIAIKSRSFNLGVKKHNQILSDMDSTFCRFIDIKEKSVNPYRGFLDIERGKDKKRWVGDYHTYYDMGGDSESQRIYNSYYAHVAKFKIADSKPWVIVLQGVTGPATLGLVQALTGGINEQFTIFSKDKDYQMSLLREIAKAPEGESLMNAINNSAGTESLFKENLNQIVKASYEMDKSGLIDIIDGIKNKNITSKIFHEQSEMITNTLTKTFDSNDSVEAIIRVYTTKGEDKNHDDRLIIWWDFAVPPRIMRI
jgi:hypothetical protein